MEMEMASMHTQDAYTAVRSDVLTMLDWFKRLTRKRRDVQMVLILPEFVLNEKGVANSPRHTRTVCIWLCILQPWLKVAVKHLPLSPITEESHVSC